MNIKNIRKARNLTQAQVAEAINVSRISYVRYENGDSEPSINVLKALASYFNTTLDDLVGYAQNQVIKPTFATRVKELRISGGLSQLQLSAKLGVDQTAISYWENGKTYPDYFNLLSLADIFNVSLDYLCARTDE